MKECLAMTKQLWSKMLYVHSERMSLQCENKSDYKHNVCHAHLLSLTC